MTFYHGSPIADLKTLKPFLSEHGKEYIYFSTNPLVSLLYAVKPVPKPFSFYPYGFDGETVVYSEYFENAFEKLYKGKSGFLYECDDVCGLEQPTQINCAYTFNNEISIDRATEIFNLYEYFKIQEQKGLFRIKPRNEISEQEMQFILNELKKDIAAHNLKETPDHKMSKFIKTNFAEIW